MARFERLLDEAFNTRKVGLAPFAIPGEEPRGEVGLDKNRVFRKVIYGLNRAGFKTFVSCQGHYRRYRDYTVCTGNPYLTVSGEDEAMVRYFARLVERSGLADGVRVFKHELYGGQLMAQVNFPEGFDWSRLLEFLQAEL